MVPRVAEPPEVSLTYQVTAAFCVPETVAEKVAEAAARTLMVCGETVTEIVAGGGGCWEPEEDEPAPQPTTRKAVKRSARNPGNVRVMIRILDSVWRVGGGRDNWTKGQKTAKLRLYKQACVNGVLEEYGTGCYMDNAKFCV